MRPRGCADRPRRPHRRRRRRTGRIGPNTIYSTRSPRTPIPKTKLEKLQQWLKQYPQTDYVTERRTLLLATYFQLGMAKEAVDVAKQVLADDPNNFSALFITVSFTQALAGQNPTPDVLDQGEKAAKSAAGKP